MGAATRFEVAIADAVTVIADIANGALTRDVGIGDRVGLSWDSAAATSFTD